MQSKIRQKFDSYPDQIREPLLKVREAIFEVAKSENIGEVEEALKWGQPSYLTRTGSTLRIGGWGNNANQYAVYFHCQTRLIETFKELYRDRFNYEGNRAIIFEAGESPSWPELKRCISMSLRYHQVKKLPLLGE